MGRKIKPRNEKKRGRKGSEKLGRDLSPFSQSKTSAHFAKLRGSELGFRGSRAEIGPNPGLFGPSLLLQRNLGFRMVFDLNSEIGKIRQGFRAIIDQGKILGRFRFDFDFQF